MTITYVSGGANNVADQVQKFWSPLFMEELREQAILASLVNRDYDNEVNGIKRMGDTVRISQVKRPAGQIKTITAGDNTFTSAPMVTDYVDVRANKRIVASFELEDLIDLQSQLGDENSAIRKALLDAAEKELNDYIYSKIVPTISHTYATLGATELVTIRKEAAMAKWSKNKGWWGLVDPTYYANLLSAQTLTSSDFVGGEQPVIGGQLINKRFGFNIVEDNTDGIGTLSAAPGAGVFFHPDALVLVMQKQPTFMVSPTHVLNKFGYILSVDFIVGCELGLEGADKMIVAKTA